MGKCKITPLEKLYEFKVFLERKCYEYSKEIEFLEKRLINIKPQDSEELLRQELNDWTQLKNEAEVALVFVKAQIAFEED